MTLRDYLTADKRLAHLILDQVKAGLPMAGARIRWALAILGDVE